MTVSVVVITRFTTEEKQFTCERVKSTQRKILAKAIS